MPTRYCDESSRWKASRAGCSVSVSASADSLAEMLMSCARRSTHSSCERRACGPRSAQMTPRVASKTSSTRCHDHAAIDGSSPSAIAGPCRHPSGVLSPSKACAVICSPTHIRKPMPPSIGSSDGSTAAPCISP